jgi:O-antigen ligase
MNALRRAGFLDRSFGSRVPMWPRWGIGVWQWPLAVALAGVASLLVVRGAGMLALATVAFALIALLLPAAAFMLPLAASLILSSDHATELLRFDMNLASKWFPVLTLSALLGRELVRGAVRPLPQAAWILIGFLAWAVAVTPLSVDVDVSVSVLQTLTSVMGLMVILGISRLTDRELAMLRTFVMLGGAGIAGLSVAQYFAGTLELADPTDELVARLGGGVGDHHVDPNLLAVTLLLPIGCALGESLRAHTRGRRLLAYAALVLMALVVLLSQSRSALLALGALLVVATWKLKLDRRLLVGAALAVLAVAASSTDVLDAMLARFRLDSLEKGSGRSDLLAMGLESLSRHWAYGSGPGTFRVTYRVLGLFGSDRLIEADAHNLYLQVAVEMGLPGLALLLAALVSLWMRLARAVPTAGSIPPGLMQGVLLSFSIAAAFLPVWRLKLFWMMLGLAMMVAGHAEERAAESNRVGERALAGVRAS